MTRNCSRFLLPNGSVLVVESLESESVLARFSVSSLTTKASATGPAVRGGIWCRVCGLNSIFHKSSSILYVPTSIFFPSQTTIPYDFLEFHGQQCWLCAEAEKESIERTLWILSQAWLLPVWNPLGPLRLKSSLLSIWVRLCRRNSSTS